MTRLNITGSAFITGEKINSLYITAVQHFHFLFRASLCNANGLYEIQKKKFLSVSLRVVKQRCCSLCSGQRELSIEKYYDQSQGLLHVKCGYIQQQYITCCQQKWSPPCSPRAVAPGITTWFPYVDSRSLNILDIKLSAHFANKSKQNENV